MVIMIIMLIKCTYLISRHRPIRFCDAGTTTGAAWALVGRHTVGFDINIIL